LFSYAASWLPPYILTCISHKGSKVNGRGTGAETHLSCGGIGSPQTSERIPRVWPTSDPVDSHLLQIMATDFASPNGIFKQLDLAEKDPDSMQEGSQLAPQPTTPVATAGGHIPWQLQKSVIFSTAKPHEATL
jgi:hypothetical protein